MFKQVNTPDTALKFQEVSSKLDKLPSWIDPGSLQVREPAVVSLRPPRVPGGLDLGSGEPESIPPASAANDSWSFAMPEERHPTPPPAVVAPPKAPSMPPPKRPDTLFDELIPRADEEAVKLIGDAVHSLVAARTAMLRDSEKEVVELARVIAERVIARELALDPRIVQGLVREGLSALSAGDQVRVKLGPFFVEVKDEICAVILRTGVQADVEIDPSVGAYGCVIETAWGSVDESVEQRLRAMLERLSVIPAAPHQAGRR